MAAELGVSGVQGVALWSGFDGPAERMLIELDAPAPRAARWVVFRDRALRDSLLRMHSVLRAGVGGLELDESVIAAASVHQYG